MRLKKIIIGLVGLVVVVIVGLVIAVATVDPNDYRGEIQDVVHDATGRQLTLGGDLELGISLRPTIVAREVELSNAEWGTQPQMVKAKELDVQVALLPLLSGDIHIVSLTVDGAEILFETNSDGVGNWQFGAQDAGDEVATDKMLLPRIDGMEITDASITYLDGVTGEKRTVDIESVELSTDSPSGPLNIDLKATSDDEGLTVSGVAGSLDALMGDDSALVDLAIAAYGVTMTLKGTVGAVSSAGNLDLDLDVSSDDPSKAASVAGVTLPFDGALKVAGHVKGNFETFDLTGLTAEVAGIKATGDISVDQSGDRPSISGKLTVEELDVSAFGGGGEGEASSDSSGKVFPSDPLPVDGLKAVDADIEVTITTLKTPVMVAKDVVLPIKLTSGDLKMDGMTATVAGSTVSSSLDLNASSATPAMVLKMTADSLNVGQMLKDAAVTEMLSGDGDLKVDVNGTGDSIAAIMASLNGEASLLMEEGQLDTGGLELLMGGSNALIGTLITSGSEAATLNCLAIDYDIKDGIAEQKVLLIDTQFSTVVGEGKIDLGKETIDLLITPKSKDVSLSVAVPVRVGGTLASPSFTPDEAALALKVGGLLGATIFPPALLLSLGDLGGGDHGCVTANANPEGSGDSGDGVVDEAGEVVDDAAGAVGTAVDDIGNEIDSLFGD